MENRTSPDRVGEILRQAAPPPNPFTIRVWTPDRGVVWTATCLSPSVYGCLTHWTGTRTVPCTVPAEHCAGCRDQRPSRWRGFLLCASLEDGRTRFVALTAKAWHDLEARLHGVTELRGIQLKISRSQKAANGRLDVFPIGRHPNPSLLPADQDPFPTLQLMWGMHESQRTLFGG